MMRILVVTCGGQAAERTLHWMIDAGHEVAVVGDWDFYKDRPPTNYRFFPSQIILEPSSDLEGAAYLEYERQLSHKMAPRLRQIAAEFQPDVVHVNAFGWHAYSCALAELRPLVVSAWGFLNFLLAQPRKPQDDISKYITSRMDGLIVENPKLVEPSRELLPPQVQVELIPMGAKLNAFRRGAVPKVARLKQQLFNLPEDTFILLSPRGLSSTYQHEGIYQAFELAYPRFNKPTAIVFSTLGRGPWKEATAIFDRINEQAKAANLENAVHWMPSMPYMLMPMLYNLADAVVNNPRTDAFPSTLIEAVACECPIISCDLYAYRDTFVEQFGTLVPLNDPEAMAAAMVQVVNQPIEERRDRMAQARQVMVEQFDEAVLSQRFVQTCEQVAQRYRQEQKSGNFQLAAS